MLWKAVSGISREWESGQAERDRLEGDETVVDRAIGMRACEEGPPKRNHAI
jgi:hypothetical protein